MGGAALRTGGFLLARAAAPGAAVCSPLPAACIVQSAMACLLFKPISYLKSNAAEVLLRLAERREPLVITQNGEAQGCAAGCGIV